MCGIVGTIGSRDPLGVIVSGLHRLEYRGYDSSGIALCPASGEKVVTVKTAGKISDLEKKLSTDLPQASRDFLPVAIGHTRWATHGKPTIANAHPHVSRDGTFAIVHNGIIENYTELKQRLESEGFSFASETDSEVLAHLIELYYEKDLRSAVAAALKCIEGTYGIAVISTRHPDKIVAARKGSPIVIGVCESETVIASDVSAIINHTNQVIFLQDGDIAVATADNVDITSLSEVPVSRERTHVDWDIRQIEKGGYDHFTLKEIFEQPDALGNAIRGRLIEKDGTTKLSGIQLTPYDIARFTRVVIASCGTSLYAGMIGTYYFEDLSDLPAEIQHAAEFTYRNPIIERDTCMLAISQSGETADTLAAVREGLRKGAVVLGVCNVVGSTIARETGRGVYIHAGPEIGVASTKAFSCQLAVLAMMAIAFGRTRRLPATTGRALVRELGTIPKLAEETLAQADHIRKIAEKYAQADDFFYIGRGYMYPAAMEGALKLKELSYVHAEGYHAAELKHGPIALLEPEVPVVALAPDIPGKSKIISNMQECRARRSPVIAIATEKDDTVVAHADDVIRVPPSSQYLAPIPVVIVEQLLAYYIAKLRGCPIDQPRNLAKSVTVE